MTARMSVGGWPRVGHVCVCVMLVSLSSAVTAPTLGANDVYYRALLPQIPPPTPAPTGQPGLIDKWFSRGRVKPTPRVIFADKPRQAAAAALRDPSVGVTLAGYALSAGVDAEHAQVGTCVDLYFEVVAFSWNFLQSPGASARPEYEMAWQLYHSGLARLMNAGQRFGRLDPTKGLSVVTAAGALTIPTTHHGFAWKPQDFTRIEVVNNTAPRKLRKHYCTPGLGVPLVVIHDAHPAERFFNDHTPFAATVVLRPSLAVLAGTAPPIGAKSSHGPLEFYDPLRISTVTVGPQQIAMATDTSAHLEYVLKDTNASVWQNLMQTGSEETSQEKLFLLEPRQPGKYPLVLVHGFFSSPSVWADITNEILARPGLRNSFQLMAYRYPTGRPFVESAAALRRELDAFVKTYDNQAQDPSMSNMVVIGHSMGGLIAKLTVTRSDDRLWCAIANRPLNEINASDASRQHLRELFYFEPVPQVRRVVFLGAPHDGAMAASRATGRFLSCCVPHSATDRIEHSLLIQQNPGVFSPEFEDQIPTSIDMMERSSCLLQAMQGLRSGECVQLHNIIGTHCLSPFEGWGDGVVSAGSAQHPFVSTEKQIPTTHRGLHEDDEAIQEIACILQRHLLEANDHPCADESAIALPECTFPDECEPCPTLIVPDECVEVPQEADPCGDEVTTLPVTAIPVTAIPVNAVPPADGAGTTLHKPPVAAAAPDNGPTTALELNSPEQ